jgi:hypothetical protein
VLTSNGTAASWQTISSGAKAASVQIFTSSGTWTKPSGYGANAIAYIKVWGGGGSGQKTNTTGQYASGGGGGGYNERWIALSSLGSTETVTIGAGALGTSTVNGSGSTGGTTTFGSWCPAYGGGGAGVSSGFSGGGGGQISAGSTQTMTGAPWQPLDCTGTGALSGYGWSWGGIGGSSNYGFAGFGSVLGGGGGGSANSSTGFAGGVSQQGGNGGAGSPTSPTAGSVPGGGGGGLYNASGTSGAGGGGQCIVYVFDGA